MKSPLQKIERIWAEHGVVKVLRTDGVLQHWTPKDAAHRAMLLSRMLENPKVPKAVYERTLIILEQVTLVAREAMHQHETLDSQSVSTRSVVNALQGTAMDGKTPLVEMPEEVQIRRLCILYPTLKDCEIAAVLRRSELQTVQKEMLMREMHRIRMREMQAALGSGDVVLAKP
jgi:hypothetical protein